VIRATLDGRFDDAERLAQEALRIARLRHSEYAAYVYEHAQLVAIRWAQGRLGEYWPEVAHHGERYLWIPRWRDALAAAELGDRGAAASELARHAGHGFADIPRDGFWLLRLSCLADACVLTDDREAGRRLYELLLPYEDRNAVALTQVPFGPVALRLGRLAELLELPDAADGHFQAALDRCELLGARAARARVLVEHGRALQARGKDAAALLDEARRLSHDLGLEGVLAAPPPTGAAEPETRFVREGEFWTIAYAGTTTRLRDVKGLGYIATLLAAPGLDVHVLELVAGGSNGRALDGDELHALDPRAKEEYRLRLEDLRSELEEARGFGDEERAAGLEEEIDALVGQLAQAVGLGGRDRPSSSPGERARVNVTKAIRTAIKLIERESPQLADHLTAAIRTGRFCSYAPPGEAPPRWATTVPS
jgi:hypothetical protein